MSGLGIAASGAGHGGGILLAGGGLAVAVSNVAGNVAQGAAGTSSNIGGVGEGGGAYIQGGTATVLDANFVSNVAQGGAPAWIPGAAVGTVTAAPCLSAAPP